MDARGPDDLSGDLAAVLDWWREAGIDCAFEDAPRPWIAARDAPDAPAPDAAAPPPPPRTAIGGEQERWPTQLSAFAPWWLSEPTLDNGRQRARVPPRGPFAAALMILVPEPEAQDHDTLLSGPQGRLLHAMLAAMGLPDDQIYFASALARHTPMADWPDLAAQGLGEVLRLHVALVRPRRVIAFGRQLGPLLWPAGFESPLSGHAPTQIIPIPPAIDHDGASVPVLVARDLGTLLERPGGKGQFWQHWLEWTAS